jgi:hypothetical protein
MRRFHFTLCSSITKVGCSLPARDTKPRTRVTLNKYVWVVDSYYVPLTWMSAQRERNTFNLKPLIKVVHAPGVAGWHDLSLACISLRRENISGLDKLHSHLKTR